MYRIKAYTTILLFAKHYVSCHMHSSVAVKKLNTDFSNSTMRIFYDFNEHVAMEIIKIKIETNTNN